MVTPEEAIRAELEGWSPVGAIEDVGVAIAGVGRRPSGAVLVVMYSERNNEPRIERYAIPAGALTTIRLHERTAFVDIGEMHVQLPPSAAAALIALL